jgi:hypothetical protein
MDNRFPVMWTIKLREVTAMRMRSGPERQGSEDP